MRFKRKLQQQTDTAVACSSWRQCLKAIQHHQHCFSSFTLTALHTWLTPGVLLNPVLPAVVQYGFKNTSLRVHNDITVATWCKGYDGSVKVPAGTYCEAPPLINPSTGTRMQDCSTWYTNRTSVMVNCPIQPNCCRDADCFNIDTNPFTINFCPQ